MQRSLVLVKSCSSGLAEARGRRSGGSGKRGPTAFAGRESLGRSGRGERGWLSGGIGHGRGASTRSDRGVQSAGCRAPSDQDFRALGAGFGAAGGKRGGRSAGGGVAGLDRKSV